MIEIHLDDLIPEKQKEILDILVDTGNVNAQSPATIEAAIILKEKEDTTLDWDKAIDYLNMMIGMYEEIGPSGWFGLNLSLYPYKKRIESGERTKELYDAIMECD